VGVVRVAESWDLAAALLEDRIGVHGREKMAARQAGAELARAGREMRAARRAVVVALVLVSDVVWATGRIAVHREACG
jgi:hypothetical protein